MTAQTTTEPPKCCFFNIKTATVALGIFHMVSYRTERGDRESDTRKERQRCNLCRRCNYCRSQGFLTVDFSVFPKEKNQLFKRDGQKKSWHGERGDRKKFIVLGGFFNYFFPGFTNWSSWKLTLSPVFPLQLNAGALTYAGVCKLGQGSVWLPGPVG